MNRQWAIYNSKVYDLSDYLYTVKYYTTSSGTDLPNYAFLNSDLSALFSTQSGQDITKAMNQILTGMSSDNATSQTNCLNNAFYVGELDFRRGARCMVQNYLLLAFSIILITTIASKCAWNALDYLLRNDPQLIHPSSGRTPARIQTPT
jgi:chitin synthase